MTDEELRVAVATAMHNAPNVPLLRGPVLEAMAKAALAVVTPEIRRRVLEEFKAGVRSDMHSGDRGDACHVCHPAATPEPTQGVTLEKQEKEPVPYPASPPAEQSVTFPCCGHCRHHREAFTHWIPCPYCKKEFERAWTPVRSAGQGEGKEPALSAPTGTCEYCQAAKHGRATLAIDCTCTPSPTREP